MFKRKLTTCFLIALCAAIGMKAADVCSDNPNICTGSPCSKVGQCCADGQSGDRGICRIWCDGSNCTSSDCWWTSCMASCGGCYPNTTNDYTDVCGSGGGCQGGFNSGDPGGSCGTSVPCWPVCCQTCTIFDNMCWLNCVMCS